MRDFIKVSDSIKFEIGNSYIIHIADVPAGVRESIDFAKKINCEKGTGCGVCRQCSKIERNEHADFTLIPNDDDLNELSSIKIEAIRELRDNAFRKPFEGQYRVFIIRHADRMTDQAQNALLKILEEPPLQSIFLLITGDVFGLLSTVRSRCRQFNYPYMKQADINYESMMGDLVATADTHLDVFFNYTKKISQTKGDLLKFLDFAIIVLRDVISLRCGHSTISSGIEDTLKLMNNNSIEEIIDKLNYYYSMVKDRSINKELIAINSLNLILGR